MSGHWDFVSHSSSSLKLCLLAELTLCYEDSNFNKAAWVKNPALDQAWEKVMPARQL